MVRHGRTAWNLDGRFQGQTDIPLCDAGLHEARAVARALCDVAFDRIISSDLSRALQTAQEIAGDAHAAIVRDPRLREKAFGQWEGLTWAEVLERYPHAATGILKTDPAQVPAGGETFQSVVNRVSEVIDEIRRSGDTRVLVVAHAGVIHAALTVLFGAKGPSDGVILRATGVTRIRMGEDGAQLVTLNDVAHLADVTSR